LNVARYAQDKEYKLYDNGSFFHFTEDLLEQNPLNPDKLSKTEAKHYQRLQKVLTQYEEHE